MKDYASDLKPKFADANVTADGSARAQVSLTHPETLWFNTGTLCNIECSNCYIASSPANDDLVYLSMADVETYLDQLIERDWPVSEIGFTGGEPFMNPDVIKMIETSLKRGYQVLVLTNAMRPMMRPNIRAALKRLQLEFGNKLTLRVSLDHYLPEVHDQERGKGSFDIALKGLIWLSENRLNVTIAGRIAFADTDGAARKGFDALFAKIGLSVNAFDPTETVLFPEMQESIDVPEITTACWTILNKSPNDIMCASSRMIVKRKGAKSPSVLACTLIAYDKNFEMGPTLAAAEKSVSLNHPHCSKFCVLGGASCSG
jgi:sulfatase maturation enzyme AslB (radical SAM superfamily)